MVSKSSIFESYTKTKCATVQLSKDHVFWPHLLQSSSTG